MSQDLINRYQQGGDIYASLVTQYGQATAAAAAQAALSGDETQINAVLASGGYGAPLNTSTWSIFGNQLETDPFAAPLASAEAPEATSTPPELAGPVPETKAAVPEPPLTDEPEVIDTAPPRALAEPATTLTAPPGVEADAPTLSEMPPAVPAALVPVETETSPDALEPAPDASVSAPELPSAAMSAVATLTPPEAEVPAPAPDETETAPPELPDEAPPETVTLAPSPAPEPAATETAPACALSAAPDVSSTEPELPLPPAPEPKAAEPDADAAAPEKTETAPEVRLPSPVEIWSRPPAVLPDDPLEILTFAPGDPLDLPGATRMSPACPWLASPVASDADPEKRSPAPLMTPTGPDVIAAADNSSASPLAPVWELPLMTLTAPPVP